jgi:tRNA (uracil-5-)-methyltransferase TRM9
MNVKEILEINKNFYSHINEEFSNTRQYPWKGWDLILQELDLKNNLKILDLGCGNGRFYEQLKNKLTTKFEYTGVDTDKGLLDIAKSKYNEGQFKLVDIFTDLLTIEDKYDMVLGFGITHHIPEKNFRREWFENISTLLNKDGYLILSFWNFLDKKSLIKATELEENDYWLGWNNKEVKRYCHYYTKEELNDINKLLYSKGLTLEKEIEDPTDLNKYLIYRYN